MSFCTGLIAAILTFIFSILYPNRPGVSLPKALTPSSAPISRLQSYLRLRTDQGDPDYTAAKQFLTATITALLPSASISVHEFVPHKPVIIASIPGNDSSLPALLLNSHTDVVPAEEEKWHWDPFAAKLVYAENEWRIYARGSQDMKSVGLQYIEALSELTREGWKPQRSVHLSYVPDEEIGGVDGMGQFVKSRVFRKLGVGVALDEGLPHDQSQFNVYYGERQTWWLVVRVTGDPGHGATLPEVTASQITHGIVARAFEFRKDIADRVKGGENIGDVVGVNVAYMKAGVERGDTGRYVMNLIPSVVEVGFDIRVPPGYDVKKMDEEITRWLTCDDGQLCPGTSHEWVMKVMIPFITSRDSEQNPYYPMFHNGMDGAGIVGKLEHGIFPAATDTRYLRQQGVECFGFSPIERTPDLLHKHNEYITMDGYLNGIKIYKELIKHLAGHPVPATPTPIPSSSATGDSEEQSSEIEYQIPEPEISTVDSLETTKKDDINEGNEGGTGSGETGASDEEAREDEQVAVAQDEKSDMAGETTEAPTLQQSPATQSADASEEKSEL